MAEDLEHLVEGGWCYFCRKNGPFVVGTDFEAPGPQARILPHLTIGQTDWDQLWSLLTKAADEHSHLDISNDAMRRLEFRNGVSTALDWYVSDCVFQADLPGFRKQLHAVTEAINRFKSALPDKASSLDHFLCGTYTGEAFTRDQLRPSQHQLMALKRNWQERTGFRAIEHALNRMLRNIEGAQTLIGGRKPYQHQSKAFVRSLAGVWEKATGQWPKSGRHPITGRQTGPFADFVRTANSVLPKRFRIPSLDGAIRAACKRPDR